MKKRNVKYIIASIVAVVIFILIILIYKNLFADSNNTRNSDMSDYKLSSEEINAVKDKFNEIEEVDSVKVTTLEDVSSRRISIVVMLNKDVDFEEIKKVSNSLFTSFSEKNLNYYDIHITVDTKEESEIYPKMGTRMKPENGETDLEFNWSR